jgi:hypothetical protein
VTPARPPTKPPEVAPEVTPAMVLAPVRLPAVPLRAGTMIATPDRSGTMLLIADRPGTVPTETALPEVAADRADVMALLTAEVALDEMQGPPMTPARAEATRPEMGTPGIWQRPPMVTDTIGPLAGDAGCANAGAARPTVRMLAEAAPPSKIRQLYTKHSTSSWLMELAAIWELTRHGN